MSQARADEYRFCPRCAGDLITRTVKLGEPSRLVCADCGFIFYLDPKVAACTIFMTTAASYCSSGRSSRRSGGGCSLAASWTRARR